MGWMKELKKMSMNPACVKQEGGDDAKEKWPCGEDPEKKDGVGMSCQQ